MSDTTQPFGAAFLIKSLGEERIFTSEKLTSEQRLFAETADRFLNDVVQPLNEQIEHPDGSYSTMVGLLKQAGELGLLMIDVPEEYGGLGLDKTTSMLCSEKLSQHGSFAVSWGAHTGIGTLPIVFFGNEAQKKKWLPLLATGEKLAAYALTEPGSGSDALAARTTATLTEDGGHYVLNGTKMWITNAGFADVFTVFAKVDGTKFTAFLVESEREGLSTGAEEGKMGLKGSSTRALNLDNVKVPKENVLGEVGRGHKIAFNILNFGRFKLGVGALGGCKTALKYAVPYALERKQFNEPIANFGAIREKFGRMAAFTYALDAMCYRVAGYMDQTINPLDETATDYPAKVMEAIEEFVVEDSIMKVAGSEILAFVVDEAVQVLGGYGYSSEYPAERAYRDARIQRIFEGTNEINRMLIPGQILKDTMKGKLPFFEAIQRVEAGMGGEKPALPSSSEGALARSAFLSERAKDLTIFTFQKAIEQRMASLKDEQELLLRLADMIIAVYAMDSTVARTQQQAEAGDANLGLKVDATALTVAHYYPQVLQIAEVIFQSLAEGSDEQAERYGAVLERFGYRHGLDVIAHQRRLAAATVERKQYAL